MPENNENIIGTEMGVLRNHPSKLLEESWAMLAFFAVTIFNNYRNISKNDEMINGKAPIIVFAVIAICLFYLLLRFFAWRKTTISIKDGLLIYKVDTINKKEHDISISTISNVNLVQNIFEMLIGTYKVKIDTNSLSTASKTDISIVLGKKEAYEFKQNIIAVQRGDSVSFAHGDNATGEKNYFSRPVVSEMEVIEEDRIVRLTSSQSVMAGIMEIPFISFIILIAAVVVPIFIGIGASNNNNTAESVGIYAILTSAFAIIGMVWGIAKNIFKYFNFTVGRDEDRVVLSYGLFTKKEYAIPVDKINGMIYETSFIGNIFKYTDVRILNVGGEAEEAFGQIMIPPVKDKSLQQYMDIILPEAKLEVKSSAGMPKKFFIYRIVKNLIIWNMITVIASKIITAEASDYWWIPVLAGAFITMLVFIYDIISGKNAMLGLTDSYIVIKNGGFTIKVSYFPSEKIQYLNRNTSPVERLLGVSRLNMSILSGGDNDQNSLSVDSAIFDKIEAVYKATY